jgi:hypothetical protein
MKTANYLGSDFPLVAWTEMTNRDTDEIKDAIRKSKDHYGKHLVMEYPPKPKTLALPKKAK